MGPRLGRVEYIGFTVPSRMVNHASMGPRLGRVEYGLIAIGTVGKAHASMGPRLGRVEYVFPLVPKIEAVTLQWGHA